MPVNPARYGGPDPSEPRVHDLPAMRYGGRVIVVRMEMRRAEDGAWRGRLLFGDDEGQRAETAEILCAESENELWQTVQDLREHHLRDLYRSVTE